MNYHWLRHFADSWCLLAMFALYIAFIGWALRPGAKGANSRAANSIFDEDRSDG